MGYYSTNEFRSGLKIIFDGEPCSILDNTFVKLGKGHAFNRVRLRKLVSDKVLENIFKSGNLVEAADIIEVSLVYLYKDSEFWYFINHKNFEQLAADAKAVSHNAQWLVEQDQCVLTLWNGKPIAVMPPNFVDLEITATDPGLKGDTVGTGGKLATLTTGKVVKVPLFVQIGDVIKVDTRSGKYVSRVTCLGIK